MKTTVIYTSCRLSNCQTFKTSHNHGSVVDSSAYHSPDPSVESSRDSGTTTAAWQEQERAGGRNVTRGAPKPLGRAVGQHR